MQNKIEKQLQRCVQRLGENSMRLESLEKVQGLHSELSARLGTLSVEQEHIKKDVGEIKADVKTLTAIPAKRWSELFDKAIWALTAAVLAYLLSGIGL